MLDPAAQPVNPAARPTSGIRASVAISTPLSQAGQLSGASVLGAGDSTRGARFQALLDELELSAQAVSKSAREPVSAESLPKAVEIARASLEDALQLGQSLLEAVRQSTAQAPIRGADRP